MSGPQFTPDALVDQAAQAQREGRYDEALSLVLELFARADNTHFMAMFIWRLLIEQHPPSRQALARERNAQASALLGGSLTFDVVGAERPRSRFDIIVNMNEMLGEIRATYELFVQLLNVDPEHAQRQAGRALPAIVAAGDYTLAQPYTRDPLYKLPELNDMAQVRPLLPPRGQPPRLATELANFVQDLALRCTVLEGVGRVAEAKLLRASALTGLADKDMHAMALRELAESGTIFRELGELAARHESIRDFREEDLPAVCRIYLEAKPDELKFEAGPFTFTPLEEDGILMAAFRESKVLVYDADGVQGFAALFEGQLRALFVQASARGQGVGKALLDAVLIKSSVALALNVARSNLDAIRFYEQNGFVITGEVTRQYSGIEVRYAQMGYSW